MPRALSPEDAVHFRVVAALRVAGVEFFHPVNESRASVAYRAKLAARGLMPGVADLILVTPPPALAGRMPAALEIKSDTGRASPAQRAWLARVASYGWATAVCRGLDECLEQLWAWGYDVPDVRVGF